MNSNLSMELVKVTEAAALAAGRWTGRGKKEMRMKQQRKQ